MGRCGSARWPCAAGCGRAASRRRRFCPACWAWLPRDVRAELAGIAEREAWHLAGAAAARAAGWLRAQRTAAIARVTGDREAPGGGREAH